MRDFVETNLVLVPMSVVAVGVHDILKMKNRVNIFEIEFEHSTHMHGCLPELNMTIIVRTSL